MMDQESCPVCKSDRYLNANLKLLVSTCYHKMCQTCIDRIFSSGSAPCPVCKQTIRKSNFVLQTFEDLVVEKEIQIRKRVGKYFNKRKSDFNNDLKAYNDYLEQVEDIFYNLLNDIDLEETNKKVINQKGINEKVELFRMENKEVISNNLARQMNEEKITKFRIEKEKQQQLLRKQFHMQLIQSESTRKKEQKDEIISLLSTSNSSPEEIIKESLKKHSQLNSNTNIFDIDEYMDEMDSKGDNLDEQFDPFDHLYESEGVYTMLDFYNEPLTASLKNDKRAIASGYLPKFTYKRGLDASYSGVFMNIL